MEKEETESWRLTEKQFSERLSPPATYPERNFCRPGAPSSTGAFPRPQRGTLPLFPPLPYYSMQLEQSAGQT